MTPPSSASSRAAFFRRLRICVITSQMSQIFRVIPPRASVLRHAAEISEKCFGPFAFSRCARGGARTRVTLRRTGGDPRAREAPIDPRVALTATRLEFAPRSAGRRLVGGDREPSSRGAGGRLRFWHLAAHGRAPEPACLRVTATGRNLASVRAPSASRAARRPRATSTRDSRDRSRGGDAAEEQQIRGVTLFPPHEKVARADILGGKDDESRVNSRASAPARATATARTLALAPTRRASLPRAEDRLNR